jgi:hypothetical protein
MAVGVTGIVPARAHSCAGPVEIPVGEETTVTVGVAAEQSPVAGFDITVPDGFSLARAEDEFDWRATQTGSLLRYRGGTLPPYACMFLNLVGTADRQAKLVFPFTVHGTDGSAVEFTGEEADDRHPAQLVYAGFSPPTSRESRGEGLRGAFSGILVAALIGIGAFAVWQRRQAPRRAQPPVRRSGPKKTKLR